MYQEGTPLANSIYNKHKCHEGILYHKSDAGAFFGIFLFQITGAFKMKLTKILSLTLLTAVATLTLSACNNSAQVQTETETRTITDVWGREVTIPMEVKTIITLGPGAPRLAAYLGVMDMLIGAEAYLTEDIFILRDYNPVHHAWLLTLPIVGAGGGGGENNGFPEEIILLQPDVILAGFDPEAANELQAQTGIPVVSIRHTTGLATESFHNAMNVFAQVVGAEARCEAVLSFIAYAKADLYNRTSGIPDSQKLRAYAGAVTFNGRRGFAGTYSRFGIFEAINALNVATTPSIDGFFEADFESIVVWDPDVIFLDPGNMDLVNAEYATNPAFFNSLRAVQEGRIYAMPAFNNAGTNITYALINAYHAGIILFPEQFADIDITEKAAEILEFFLGKNIFDQMAANGLHFNPLIIGE